MRGGDFAVELKMFWRMAGLSTASPVSSLIAVLGFCFVDSICVRKMHVILNEILEIVWIVLIYVWFLIECRIRLRNWICEF